eukprot:4832218-Pleurochrysis_carterae.AAC.1
MKRAVTATTVSRQARVWCEAVAEAVLLIKQASNSRAHRYTVTREAGIPLDQGVAMHFRVSTQRTNNPYEDV